MPDSVTKKIVKIRAPFSQEEQDLVTRFYFSLSSEQELFNLPLEHIMSANRLAMLFHEDRVVGIAGIRSVSKIGLYFMAVHRDFHGKGLGKKLMDDALSMIGPFELLMLTVQRSNVKARRLYKTMDFVTIYRYKIDAIMLYMNTMGRCSKLFVQAALVFRSMFKAIF